MLNKVKCRFSARKIIIATFFIGSILNAKAQQLQTTSFMDMQSQFHNASLAGTQKDNIVGVSYRTQWTSISGAPKTATVFGSFELPKYNFGIGGNAFNDVTGPTSRTGLNLSIAKHIHLNNGATFSIGIENKIQQYALNRAKLSATLGSDPALGTAENKFKYDAGFGIAYVSDDFTIGASVSQLVQSKLNFYVGNLTKTEEARLYRHYYFHGTYNWDVDGITTISPNALVTYLPNAPTELAVGVRVEHAETFWWGIGYRLRQNFSLNSGVNINKKLSVGYAYDAYVNPINNFSAGAAGHEFMLRYHIEKKGKK
jgi:type IX secretion system PorP/SprF family membrane protein